MVKKASKISSLKNIEKKSNSKKDKKSTISKSSVISYSKKSRNIVITQMKSAKKQKYNPKASVNMHSLRKEANMDDKKSNFSDDFFQKQLKDSIKVL